MTFQPRITKYKYHVPYRKCIVFYCVLQEKKLRMNFGFCMVGSVFFYSESEQIQFFDSRIRIKVIYSRIREPDLKKCTQSPAWLRVQWEWSGCSLGFVARDVDGGDGVEYISNPAGREGGCPPSFKQRYTLLSPRWEGPLFPALMFS